MSLQMLEMAKQQGIDYLVASPHFYASQNSPDQFLDRRSAAWEQLQGYDLSNLPQLILGAEVAFFSGIGKAEGIEKLCMGRTNLLLLEMPFCAWSSHTIYEVKLLAKRGMIPILAHLERFYSFQKDRDIMSELLDLPVYVQINAECLSSWAGRRRAMKLFRENQAHFLGSDCHNTTTRPPNCGLGREILRKKLGQEVLTQMDRLGSEILGV